MMIVLVVILILLTMAFPYLKKAKVQSRMATTRNHLNQIKTMISEYYTDYRTYPLSNHLDTTTFTDTTAVQYWKRFPSQLLSINKSSYVNVTENAVLSYDAEDNYDKDIKSESEFDVKYPTKNMLIELYSWYNGATTDVKIHDEELSAVAHSSRFLNYYLSGSGFDFDRSYIKEKEFWLQDESTSFKPSFIHSGLVRPFLYSFKNVSIFYNPTDIQIPTVPPVSHYGMDTYKFIQYFDYLPKIIGPWNTQKFSKNTIEEKYRQLYKLSDKALGEGSPPTIKGQYSPKYKTFVTDKIIFNRNYYEPSKKFDNVNSMVYMKAHARNVRAIVDAFNTPIVYITYMNQRREAAATYQTTDPDKKDISMRTTAFLLYSLGPNKSDDSDLGQNYFEEKGTGDDVIEAVGTK